MQKIDSLIVENLNMSKRDIDEIYEKYDAS